MLSQSLLLSLLAFAALATASLSGGRKQYHLQSQDGAYQFGYDTGPAPGGSISQAQQADAANQVQGGYVYSAPDGSSLGLTYTAGVQGFVPSGNALSHSSSPGVLQKSSVSGAHDYSASSHLGSSGSEEQSSGDASYNFAIDTDSYKRNENSDSRGNIQGQYSYVGKEGGTHGVSYVAGEGVGFLVTSSSGGPALKSSQSSGNPAAFGVSSYQGKSFENSLINQAGPASDGSYSFSYQASDHSRQESADGQNNVQGSYTSITNGKPRKIDYTAGANTGFVATGDIHVVDGISGISSGYSAPALKTNVGYSPPFSGNYLPPSTGYSSSGPIDGSYSFAYQTGDSSRVESADSSGKVHGSYSFIAKDNGQTHTVNYEAGAEKGFIAQGKHLPQPGDSGISSIGAKALGFETSPLSQPGDSGVSSIGVKTLGFGTSPLEVNHGINGGNSAAYTYSYQTDSSKKQESSDDKGNVKGSYSFISKDDGQTHSVNYEAGAGKGFIVQGDHLPQSRGNVATSRALSGYTYGPSNAGLNHGFGGGNAAYSYSYQTDSSSKHESSDDKGNVQGSFSYISKDDGQTRTVNYEAGAEKGFIAQGNHLPKTGGGELGSVSVLAKSGAGYGINNLGINQDGGNAAYSYSYQTDSSSKHESSDEKGNVQGSFQQLGADGILRKTDYSSIGDEGFVIKQAEGAANQHAGYSSHSAFTKQTSGDGGEFILKGGKVKTYLPPQPKVGYEFRAIY